MDDLGEIAMIVGFTMIICDYRSWLGLAVMGLGAIMIGIDRMTKKGQR